MRRLLTPLPLVVYSPSHPCTMMPRDDDNLVYSTDGSHRQICTRCGGNPCHCPGPVEIHPATTVLRIKLEKAGRKGKSVTLIYDMPTNEAYFTKLTKQLKAHCGTGGAYKDGGIELQGDQRDKAQAYLEGLGFQVRRSGG